MQADQDVGSNFNTLGQLISLSDSKFFPLCVGLSDAYVTVVGEIKNIYGLL
jgi:hypothetical protein